MWDVRRLRFFMTVAERLNVSRAAEALNISQSALSRQIQGFEAEIGVQLFDRVGKRLVLTAEGEHLLPRIAALLTQVEGLTSRADAVARGQIGFLRIGATPQTIASLLSRALAVFRRRQPGVEVALVEAHNNELIAMVERGAVNLAIAALPRHHDLAGEDLFMAQLLVLLPPGDRRHHRARLSIEEIAEDPLLILRRGFMTRDLFERSFQRAELRPRILLESDSPHTLVALAEAGHGCAVLSSSAAIRPRKGRLIPLVAQGQPIEQMVSIVWNPSRHQAAASSFLCETLKEHAARRRLV